METRREAVAEGDVKYLSLLRPQMAAHQGSKILLQHALHHLP